VLVPLSVVQRYRVGSRRQRARSWVASLQVAGFTLSAGLLVVGAAISSLWIPSALLAASGGLIGGVVVGAIGAAVSRWEHHDGVISFTPNRWLALSLAAVVAVRLAYGAWRVWAAWSTGAPAAWTGAGIAGSMAAGALLVGYGLGFWVGVRWRITRQRPATTRTPR
jgi:hypothetical protein